MKPLINTFAGEVALEGKCWNYLRIDKHKLQTEAMGLLISMDIIDLVVIVFAFFVQ
jgi:hypothetical protein